MDRLLIMHTVITMAIGSLYSAPVDMEKPQRILDIGTGNGVWAIEIADQFPNSTVGARPRRIISDETMDWTYTDA